MNIECRRIAKAINKFKDDKKNKDLKIFESSCEMREGDEKSKLNFLQQKISNGKNKKKNEKYFQYFIDYDDFQLY